MGAFGTGFLGSIGDAVHQKAQLARENEQKQKDIEAQYHWGALQQQIKNGGRVGPNGDFIPYTPEDVQGLVKTATDNMAKAYGGSKPVKQVMERAQQIIGKATGHPLWGHPGSENIAPSEGGTNPAAPETGAAAQPSTPAAQASAVVPPPPGLDARSASDQSVTPTLDANATSDASSQVAPNPTSALASPSPAGDGKSAPSDPTASISGPSDSSDQSTSAPDLSVPRGTSATAPQGLPTPSPAPTPAVPPPPSAATVAPAAVPAPVAKPNYQNMLSSVISPYQAQQLKAQQGLRENQASFDQGQAQLQQKIANLEKLTGHKLTPTQIQLAAGIKLPAGMFTPHYDSKTVLAEQAAANGVMADGSSPSDHPGQILQQIGQTPDGPLYNTTSVQPKVVREGNEWVAYNPVTMERYGSISGTPINPGTSTSRVAPVTTMGPDGKLHQYAGSSSNRPNTVNTPAIGGGQIPSPPGAVNSTPTVPVTAPNGVIHQVPAGGAKKSQQPIAAAGAATATSTPLTGAGPTAARTLGEGEITVGQYQQQQKRNTAINGAGQALVRFSAPQEDGTGSNLDIFKDKDGIARIANYLKMNNDQIEGQFEQAEKSGATGVASFYVGLPQAYAAASTQAVRDKYDVLTPKEKRFVTDYYALLGQWGGMRAASGASGSLWNFRNLSQEIPNPMSITSYPEAVRKIKDNAAEIAQTAKPNTIATKYTEKDFLPQEQGKKKSGGSVPAPPNGAKVAAKTYKAYAIGPNGHRIGSNDGQKTWYDEKTGELIK